LVEVHQVHVHVLEIEASRCAIREVMIAWKREVAV
jgi:hypothetical protein